MGRRIGILGGTFDPVHIGHLIVGQEVQTRCNLDRVLFVPAAEPPHKNRNDLASAEDRTEMVRLAILDNPAFELSRIEVDRKGISYTVETLRLFREQFGSETSLFLIIGADNALEMSTWCDPSGVLDLAQVTVVARPEFDRQSIGSALAEKMTFLETPLLDISATEIRRRVKVGHPISYLVPERVVTYIQERGLYL
jgi:nicotinate-nucleotide adenylyltransferase